MEQIHKAIKAKSGSVTVTGKIQFCVEGNFTFQTEKTNKYQWGILASLTEFKLKTVAKFI